MLGGEEGRAMSRQTIRYAAAGIATLMALIYFMIGLEVVQVVVEQPAGSDIFGFGAGAGALFLGTAAVIVLVDRRVVWAIAVILQILIAVIYFAVAPTRDPNFEVWGITLRVLQLGLFAALVYLALHRPVETREAHARIRPPR
jgi:hypothetical protein